MADWTPSCEPVAWIVHAQYPYVTMDAPFQGGLPRTNLYTAAQLAAEVAAAVAKERERCAALCDQEGWHPFKALGPLAAAYADGCRNCAAAIRTGEGGGNG